jgi:hypothetical protein
MVKASVCGERTNLSAATVGYGSWLFCLFGLSSVFSASAAQEGISRDHSRSRIVGDAEACCKASSLFMCWDVGHSSDGGKEASQTICM